VVLENTTDDPKEELVVLPNRHDVVWGYNPENLRGKSLDKLNALVQGKDPNYFLDNSPFDDPQEAIAFLSREF
jgi:hypothetical protein